MLGKVRLRRPAPGTVLGGLALIVATSGVAVAAIPSSGGVIATCFKEPRGVWRPIDAEAGARCKSGETRLDIYSKGGAEAAFLGKTAKAADSDLLDGLNSIDFLRSNAAAGGALAGNYPNPSIAAGAVTSSHIFDGTIGPIDIGANAVTTPKLDDGAVTTDKLNDGAVTTAKLDANATAPNADKLDGKDSSAFLGANAKAADSDKLDGEDSAAFQRRVTGACAIGSAIKHIDRNGLVLCQETGGVTGYEIFSFPFTLGASESAFATMRCASPGTRALSGGVLSSVGGGMEITQSYPLAGGSSWVIEVADRGRFEDQTGEFYLVCANASP